MRHRRLHPPLDGVVVTGDLLRSDEISDCRAPARCGTFSRRDRRLNRIIEITHSLSAWGQDGGLRGDSADTAASRTSRDVVNIASMLTIIRVRINAMIKKGLTLYCRCRPQ